MKPKDWLMRNAAEFERMRFLFSAGVERILLGVEIECRLDGTEQRPRRFRHELKKAAHGFFLAVRRGIAKHGCPESDTRRSRPQPFLRIFQRQGIVRRQVSETLRN